MTSSLRLLRLIALLLLLLSVTRLSEAIGPLVRCEPCDVASVRSQCAPLPSDCAEKVREPGCGCCVTCALGKGQSCGIYTNRCGSGLSCQPRSGETRPLLALLEGRGICAEIRRGISVPARGEDNTTEEDGSSKVTGGKDSGGGGLCGLTGLKALLALPKAEVVKNAEDNRSQRSKAKPLTGGGGAGGGGVGADGQNFSCGSNQEAESGPCSREIEAVLNSLKLTDIINPQGLHIPNCDKKGFYKKKQCRPSKGRQRGFCWCVDKYGQPLPGNEGTERSDAQCYSENQ